MSSQQKKEKILSIVNSERGWMSCEIYWNEAQELKAAGLIKMSERITAAGGNRKNVWVAA